MANITVLGGGMVGSAMAKDLASQHQVSVLDINERALQPLTATANIKTRVLDVSDIPALQNAVAHCDLVINAVPGFLGFNTLKQVIEAGKNVVDIAFYPQDALSLDSLAKQKNVTAIVDMGVAPGMSNLILGYHNEHMAVQEFACYVGGLPKVRHWPFYYKAPFSPVDVIEEYTRPARLMEHGQVVEKPALSERELLEFDNVGTLEAFNTDGLRSLLTTMSHIPHMAEKTLRYPGHAELIQALIHSGFFQESELDINGQRIAPMTLTSELLRRQWQLQPQDKEFTVMRIMITGRNGNDQQRIVYDLYDEYDEATQTSSMARTTGYTCTAAANLILSGRYTHAGISPPEYVGKEGACFDFIFEYLRQRGIEYKKITEHGVI
jgi:lysine 6-dehydrogenase